MPTAYLTTHRLKVSLTSERLEITVPPEADETFPMRRWIPLVDVEQVVVDAGVSIPTRTLCGLLRRKIPVLFLSHGRFPAGVALPMNGWVKPLEAQLDACRDPEFSLAQARLIVAAKIRNMRRVIQRLAANRSQPALAAQWLGALVRQAEASQSIDALRGLEGAATGRYFEIIGSFFPRDLPFERRSRRPPHNPPNALLSFTYTLLVSEFVLHLRATGLEPGWGLYHSPEDNRPALALDLIEPFRAPVADALALDLFNHRRLTAEDFEFIDGGCLLKQTSRRRLFTAYEERLQREFLYEQSGRRTTLRQLIKDHCTDIKKAFSQRIPFKPFVMN